MIMRWCISKGLLTALLAVVVAGAGAVTSDTLRISYEEVMPSDSLSVQEEAYDAQLASLTSKLSKYERRVEHYQRFWNFLIPKQLIFQYAGNMGMFSVGLGWDYGHHRNYETNLLFGYLPKFNSSSAKMTMTIKQNFIPWHAPIDDVITFEPFTCGIYFNTVFGSEFWQSQPKRYPDSYYDFLSTKVRINIFIGERLTLNVPDSRRKFIKGITAFYEVSTCDLYIRAMIQDKQVSLWDIIGLSLGLKFQLL